MQQAHKSNRLASLSGPAAEAVAAGRHDRASIALVIVACVLIPLGIATGLALSNETKVIGLVLSVLGGLVILAWPFYGLVFFVALLYTRPEESIPELAGMHFTLVISLVTLAGWFIGVCLKRSWLVRAPIIGMMISFGLLAVVSAVPGNNLVGAVMDISRLVMLVVLVVNLIRNRDQYHYLINAVVAFTSYLAGYSIYLYQHGAALMVHGDVRSRAGGIFSDPNDLATTIAGGLAFVLFRLSPSRGIRRLGYAALAGVCVWAITLTGSRSGLLSLLAVGVGWIVLSCRDKRAALIAAACLAVVAFLFAPSRMTNFDSGEESANSRFWFWSEGIDQLVAHPILGVGYGRFPSVNGGLTAHNSFVLCFAELGLLAYFCWIGCLYYCYNRRPGLRNQGDADSDKDRINLIAARLALSGYLTGSFWLSHTYSPILYLLMSLAASAQLISYGEATVCRLTSSERMRHIAKIASMAIISIIIIQVMAIHYRGR